MFSEKTNWAIKQNKRNEYASISLLASTISCCNTVLQSFESFEGQDFSDPKPIAKSRESVTSGGQMQNKVISR